MSELRPFRKTADNRTRGECPPPAIWGELAAGLMTRNTAFGHLEHAGSCPACAEELQYALYAIGGPPAIADEIRQHLATGTEEWQRRFAQQIAAHEIPAASDKIAHPSSPQRGGVRSFLSRTWKRMAKAVRKKKPNGR